MERAVETRQREVARFAGIENGCAIGRRRSERSGALAEVQRQRAAEQLGEAREIDAVAVDEGIAVRHRDADIPPAQSLGLKRPAELAGQLAGRDSDRVAADIQNGHVLIASDALKRGLGWELKPEGLCKDEICVPVRDRGALVPDAEDAGVDLAAFAAALGRPLAVEPDARVAALGVAAGERASQLATLEAPDFELPDLSGQTHRLSDHRGKKVLLIAYASW